MNIFFNKKKLWTIDEGGHQSSYHVDKGAWKTFGDWHAKKGYNISLFMEDLPKQEDI
jgi:hypothetical protein